jgi:hypothetical protein
LPSVTLGKGFAECKIAFAECLRHSAKNAIPVVRVRAKYKGGCLINILVQQILLLFSRHSASLKKQSTKSNDELYIINDFFTEYFLAVLTPFSGVNHSTRTVAVLSAQGRTVHDLTQG